MHLYTACLVYGRFRNRGTLLGGPLKGILFHLGYKRGTPILGNTHIRHNRIFGRASLHTTLPDRVSAQLRQTDFPVRVLVRPGKGVERYSRALPVLVSIDDVRGSNLSHESCQSSACRHDSTPLLQSEERLAQHCNTRRCDRKSIERQPPPPLLGP